MKKKLSFLLIISLVFLVIACGNSKSSDEEAQGSVKDNANIEISEDNNNHDLNFENEETKLLEDGIKKKNISYGEEVLIDDFVSFVLEDMKWTEAIKPSDTSGAYIYYPKQHDEIYYVISGIIKNLSSDSIVISNYTTKYDFKFNEKYNYEGDATADFVDSLEDTLKPLKESKFYIYVSVPEEIKEKFDTCELEIKIGDGIHYLMSEEDIKYIFTIKSNN